MSQDGRSVLKAKPPRDGNWPNTKRAVTVYMEPDVYRMAYDQALERKTSLTEAIKQIIREAGDNE